VLRIYQILIKIKIILGMLKRQTNLQKLSKLMEKTRLIKSFIKKVNKSEAKYRESSND